MDLGVRDEPGGEGFQLAPLVDVVFLLLIFFLVTFALTQAERELVIDLPTAETAAEPTGQPGDAVLNLLADGTLKMNGAAMSPDTVERRLRTYVDLVGDAGVLLLADRNSRTEHLVGAFDLCRRAGVDRIRVATALPEDER